MFDERPSDRSPIFVGHHVPGTEIKQSISDGDSVALRIGAEQVLVRNIVQIDPEQYKGQVHGFEPSLGTSFQGITVDEEVEFNESHVFSCSRG